MTLEQLISHLAVLDENQDQDQIIGLCFQGLKSFGDQVPLLERLAAIFYGRGDLARSCNYLERLCAALEPDRADRWLQLGTVLGSADRSRDAVQALQRAWDMDPELKAAGVNLGITLVKLQWNAQAAKVLGEVVEHFPEEYAAHLWLGHAYTALNDLEQSAQSYEKTLADPQLELMALMPLALAYRGLGDLSKSNSCFEKVLAQEPEQPMARFALAQNQLMVGDFESGFANYEYRWLRPGMERPEKNSPLWQGEDISGKTLLIHDEQGFGDCIQFSRFLAAASGLGAHILFQPRQKLSRLMQGLQIADIQIVGEGETGEDYHLPLMSLPQRLLLSRDQVSGTSYLSPEQGISDLWMARLADMAPEKSKRVGLVWQGDPSSQSEQGRSIPFEFIQQLFASQNVEFFLLQMCHGREGLDPKRLPQNVHDLGDVIDREGDAFIDTAAIMTHLDLMITSDTATAHLAGALGVPGFVLLKHVPEWRWGLTGEMSHWYDSLELIRQPRAGDWAAVMDQVSDRLKG